MTRPFDITAGSLPNGTLIEASAGTGKTHTVSATVATRRFGDASFATTASSTGLPASSPSFASESAAGSS